MFSLLWPSTNCLLVVPLDLHRHCITHLFVLLGAVLLGNLDAVRHLNPLTVLTRHTATLRHIHVLALLVRDVLALLSVVVGRLALLRVLRGAVLLLLLPALFLVYCSALLLLLALADLLVPGGAVRLLDHVAGQLLLRLVLVDVADVRNLAFPFDDLAWRQVGHRLAAVVGILIAHLQEKIFFID